jgi:hypothetical protein
LISQPDSSKCAFGIVLAAHICRKYRIAKAWTLFEECVLPKLRALSQGFLLFHRAFSNYLNSYSQTTSDLNGSGPAVLPTLIMTPSVLVETIDVWPIFAETFPSHRLEMGAIIKEFTLPVIFSELKRMYIDGEGFHATRLKELDQPLVRIELFMQKVAKAAENWPRDKKI